MSQNLVIFQNFKAIERKNLKADISYGIKIHWRTDSKKSLDVNEVNNTLNNRIELITRESAEITALVQASIAALTDDPNTKETHQSLDYIPSIIVDGFR
jgi:hypothetical protein